MAIMKILTLALTFGLFAIFWAPAQADEIEDTLKLALEAYQAGDIETAKEEVDYAAQLFSQLRAASFRELLPEALPGWTRTIDPAGTTAASMFGGGLNAVATYSNESDTVEIQYMAESQIVVSMAMMFGNSALLGSLGQVKRINRQSVVITQDGTLQSLIDNRVFVQISGTAQLTDMEAYFASIDIGALEDF
ncbi:MAG: hypothetical protein ACC631_08110 [Halocynthiibacter sp.]